MSRLNSTRLIYSSASIPGVVVQKEQQCGPSWNEEFLGYTQQFHTHQPILYIRKKDFNSIVNIISIALFWSKNPGFSLHNGPWGPFSAQKLVKKSQI